MGKIVICVLSCLNDKTPVEWFCLLQNCVSGLANARSCTMEIIHTD